MTKVDIRYQGFPFHFDLSTEQTTYQKTHLINSYIRHQHVLLPLLLIITRWGRVSGTVQHDVSQFMSLFGLVWLFIDFCVRKAIVTPVEVVYKCACIV